MSFLIYLDGESQAERELHWQKPGGFLANTTPLVVCPAVFSIVSKLQGLQRGAAGAGKKVPATNIQLWCLKKSITSLEPLPAHSQCDQLRTASVMLVRGVKMIEVAVEVGISIRRN